MEEWKDVPGFEGYYQISSIGRVKSLMRIVNCNGGEKVKPESILTPKTDKDGYKAVTFCVDNKMTYCRINRLMLLAFSGPPPIGKEMAIHLDDIPYHNVLSNLKWGSNSENILMAIANGKKPPTRPWLGKKGKDHHASKKVSQYSLSGQLINTFYGILEASRIIKVCFSCISDCCRGKQLTAGGFRWKYAS